MQHFFSWYAPHMLAAYMDFAVGILIAAVVWVYGFHATPTFLTLFAGAILALLPDIDLVWPILRGQVQGDHHQLPTHFPLVMLTLVPLAAFVVSGRRGMILAFVCLAWHFIHDTREFGGGGIAWLWPFSSDYWSLSGSSTPSIAPHADEMQKLWGTPNAFAVRELAIGSLSLFAASAILKSRGYVLLACFIALGVWTTTALLWSR